METANGWNDVDPCAPIGTDSDGDGLCDMEESLLEAMPTTLALPKAWTRMETVGAMCTKS